MADAPRWAVIGHPVGHSRSPALFAWWLERLGRPGSFEAVDVAPPDLPAFLDEARAGRWSGFSVTLPHKESILPLLDEVDPAAQRIGAVNCVSVVEGALTGANTDATGLLRSLRRAGADPAGQAALVLGAGGAARAAAFALVDAGARKVWVANRTEARADELVLALGRDRAQAVALSASALAPVLGEVGPVVQATRVGLDAPGEDPLPPGCALTADHTVLDMVYRPLETALCARARDAGATVVDGLWMLVDQALDAWERWTGDPAPRGLAAPLHAHLARDLLEESGGSGTILEGRAVIDAVDREILRLLGLRFSTAGHIGALKAALGEPVVRPEREASLRALHRRWAEAAALDPGLAERVFDVVLDASRALQQRLQADPTPSTPPNAPGRDPDEAP